MRVSALKHDAGYLNYIEMRRMGAVVIKLDGVEQDQVVTADADNGMIVRHVVVDGKVQHHGGLLLTETLRGKVQISTRPLL